MRAAQPHDRTAMPAHKAPDSPRRLPLAAAGRAHGGRLSARARQYPRLSGNRQKAAERSLNPTFRRSKRLRLAASVGELRSALGGVNCPRVDDWPSAAKGRPYRDHRSSGAYHGGFTQSGRPEDREHVAKAGDWRSQSSTRQADQADRDATGDHHGRRAMRCALDRAPRRRNPRAQPPVKNGCSGDARTNPRSRPRKLEPGSLRSA
jgi:hypothetical protein